MRWRFRASPVCSFCFLVLFVWSQDALALFPRRWMSVSTPRNQRPRSLRSSVPSACDLWNIGDVSCVASLNSVPTQVSARLEHPRSFIVVSACESDYIGDVSGRVRGRWSRVREQAGSATSTGRGSAIPIISRAVLSALYLCQIGDVRFFQVFFVGIGSGLLWSVLRTCSGIIHLWPVVFHSMLGHSSHVG